MNQPESPIPQPAPLPPHEPGLASSRVRPVRDPGVSGCLKWGLFGCAALAVVLITGLMLFARKAPQLMERLLGMAGEQVVDAVAPTVSREELEAFQKAFGTFVEGAKAQKVKPEEIREVQSRIVEALRDGQVSPDELTKLTEEVRRVSAR